MTEIKEMIDLGNKIKSRLVQYERFIIAVIAICVAIKYLHVPLSGLISTLLLSTIGVMYFFSAFSTQYESEVTAFDIVIYKLSGFASSVLVVGILFTIQHWPGDRNMLIMGLFTLLISLIYMILQNRKRSASKPFDQWLIIRIAVLIIIALGLMIDKLGLAL
jgi:hypothetical protein